MAGSIPQTLKTPLDSLVTFSRTVERHAGSTRGGHSTLHRLMSNFPHLNSLHPVPYHPIPSHPIPSHLTSSHPISHHAISSHPLPSYFMIDLSHLIPSHPIPPHPIPSHPIPSHPIPPHPIPPHPIPSHTVPLFFPPSPVLFGPCVVSSHVVYGRPARLLARRSPPDAMSASSTRP